MAFEKSPFSNPSGNSVEVDKDAMPGKVLVRDSKQNDDPRQPVLEFDHAEWDAFLSGVKLGHFDVYPR